MGKKLLLCLHVLLCAIAAAQSPHQSAALTMHTVIPVLPRIQNNIQQLDARLERHAHKYLQKLARKEAKLKSRLMKTDSVAAKQLFEGTAEQYARLSANLTHAAGNNTRIAGAYLPNVDSLKSTLSFLQQNSDWLTGEEAKKVTSTFRQLQQMQGRLQQADAAKAFIQNRRQQIKEVLSRYTQLPKSITQTYQGINKDLYYYTTQVQEYKDMLNDPDKIFTKALALLNKLPAFQTFLQQHSELAGLFAVPASYGAGQSLAGMQTRNDVQQLMQAQYASAGPNVNQLLQQNMQAAQAQLNQLKDRINKLGNAGADMDMPNFKPNNQKTKAFWKRLEYGTNLQTQKTNNYFPTTSDIGLSVGYKLNDKSVLGIGGSYKVGWGKDIKNINISSQGAGLRSFLDVKLKGSFYATGGWEYNYQPLSYTQTLTAAEQQQTQPWQQSGLAGISKIISLKSKTFKKTKAQLLWDFLSYGQIPRAQAVKFRIGYNF